MLIGAFTLTEGEVISVTLANYNVHEAKSNLSRLLQKTAAGERVIIMRDARIFCTS